MSRIVGLKVRFKQKLAFLEDEELEQFDISDWPLICQHCPGIVLMAVMRLDVSDITLSHLKTSKLFG